MQLAVSELGQEFSGKIVTESIDATTPENQELVQSLGFNNHGLVIRSANGEALWKQPDHKVVMDDVKKAVEDLIAAR